jgi:ankyrin repeat protein
MLNSESDIEKVNNFENSKELNDPNCETIKKLLIQQNLYPDNNKNLKYLLSIILKKEQKNFDFQYLLSFLLTFKTEDNINIFYDYFFQCCELGKINYVTLLLNNHLSINYQNELGETPMHIAITKKDINLMKLLLEYNPVLTIKTYKDNLNCYNYADISGNEEIKNLLYSKINSSKEIKSKLKSFINGIDSKNSMSSIESGAKKNYLITVGKPIKVI